jgi:hypothetical protein
MAKKSSERSKKTLQPGKAKTPDAAPVGPVTPVGGDGAATAAAVAPKATGGKGRAKGQACQSAAKPRASKPRRASGLDAAAGVLSAARKPMRCNEVVEVILSKGLWKTGGKTPAATINAAMLREIKAKGKESRFRKAGRGLFAAA